MTTQFRSQLLSLLTHQMTERELQDAMMSKLGRSRVAVAGSISNALIALYNAGLVTRSNDMKWSKL